MSGFEVRPFRRSDRDQVTSLMNAHVQAVIPGLTVSVNAVLSHLERQPDELILDAWVQDRTTLVAEQRGRIVAATHLLRYQADPAVGLDYRGLGEIRWFLCTPDAPFWPDATTAGLELLRSAQRWLTAAGAERIAADGALPAPGVFGIPDCWPHIAQIFTQAGLRPGHRREHVSVLDLTAFISSQDRPDSVQMTRSVGAIGTRFTASVGGVFAGAIEVEPRSVETGPAGRQGGWADIGHLGIEDTSGAQGIKQFLLEQAVTWLRLGHIDRLLAYNDEADTELSAFLKQAGFQRLTTTTRGWAAPNDPVNTTAYQPG